MQIKCLNGENLGVVLGIKDNGEVIQLSGRRGTEEYKSGNFYITPEGEFAVKDNDPSRDGLNSVPRELTDEERTKYAAIISQAVEQHEAR